MELFWLWLAGWMLSFASVMINRGCIANEPLTPHWAAFLACALWPAPFVWMLWDLGADGIRLLCGKPVAVGKEKQ